jgi:translation initiation factor 1
MADEKSRLVYSTAQAVPRLRDTRKNKPSEKALQSDLEPAQQKVIVRLDRKGRGGKSVTIVEGLHLPFQQREALLRQLKSMLGTGGTVKDTGFEIQGDRRDALMGALEKMGFRPKRSGG